MADTVDNDARNLNSTDESDTYFDAIDLRTITISSRSGSEVQLQILDETPSATAAAAAAQNMKLEFDDEYSNLLDIECRLCSELVLFGKGATIPGCRHSMCPNCVAKAILMDQSHCPVKEFNRNCVSKIPTGLVRHVLPAEEFKAYQARSLESLDDMDLVMNINSFDCPVCFCLIAPGHGVVLRDCIHEFCIECIKQTVSHCQDAQVVCPFKDKDYSCGAFLQQREIRGVLGDQTAYDQHLLHCLKVAERRLPNTFHCKTRDCSGFCILEADQQSFVCPVCDARSCTNCEAIHEDVTCKEYQDWKRSKTGIGLQEYSSKVHLENLLQIGEAMMCPKCKAVVTKIEGCDALKCTMCLTALCWATKGARWGPRGPGDTSGGCRCKVNGLRCHVNCANCH